MLKIVITEITTDDLEGGIQRLSLIVDEPTEVPVSDVIIEVINALNRSTKKRKPRADKGKPRTPGI